MRASSASLSALSTAVYAAEDDHFGAQLEHGLRQAFGLAQVATRRAVAVQRNDIPQHTQATLQFPAYLAVFTQKQNLHALRPAYCLLTQSL